MWGFFLAYILQQYHNTLLYTETRRCGCSGSGAVPVPAGGCSAGTPPPPSPGRASGARGGQGGLAGPWELPTAPSTPTACMGGSGLSCLSLPAGQGGSGGSISPLPLPLHPAPARSAARLWRAVFQLRPFSQPRRAAAEPGSKRGYGTRWERVGGCRGASAAQRTGYAAAVQPSATEGNELGLEKRELGH